MCPAFGHGDTHIECTMWHDEMIPGCARPPTKIVSLFLEGRQIDLHLVQLVEAIHDCHTGKRPTAVFGDGQRSPQHVALWCRHDGGGGDVA